MPGYLLLKAARCSWAAAVAFGTLAGLVGGLLFTVVMVLVGALLFRRQSFDVESGIGWGVSYGFFWWVLGDLTLPILLDGA